MPTIRPAQFDDAQAIAEIYNWYIANTTITFEEDPITAGDMVHRIAVTDESRPWFVLEQEAAEGEESKILGFACAVRWKDRSAYRFSRETSIYLLPDSAGSGHGRLLYEYLIDAMRKTEVHTLIAGIALPNDASIALHEKLGFRQVGEFEEVGKKFGNFLNVGYWQLQL
ncbi:MAG: N-acetyltransferase family protein [Gammaproteobacteria bacterium]